MGYGLGGVRSRAPQAREIFETRVCGTVSRMHLNLGWGVAIYDAAGTLLENGNCLRREGVGGWGKNELIFIT